MEYPFFTEDPSSPIFRRQFAGLYTKSTEEVRLHFNILYPFHIILRSTPLPPVGRRYTGDELRSQSHVELVYLQCERRPTEAAGLAHKRRWK